jgi:AcrR family transcriptional regulator
VSAAPTTPRDQPRRAAVTRRLEDVALELFAARGFDETTVDELAAAGGVGRRTFFRYFPTKFDVVLGELDDGLTALVDVLVAEPGDDPVAAARAAFLAVNRYTDDEVPALRRRLGLIEDVPELAARATVRYRVWEQALAADAGRRWDASPSTLSARVFGQAVVAAMRAVFTVWHARPDAGAADLGALVDEAFAVLARGFARP